MQEQINTAHFIYSPTSTYMQGIFSILRKNKIWAEESSLERLLAVDATVSL